MPKFEPETASASMVTHAAKDLMKITRESLKQNWENVWCFLLFAVAHYKIAKLLEASISCPALLQAPEIIMRKGTGVEADYWALGVLIFELLVGEPPFKSLSGDPWDTFRQILSGRFFVPHTISKGAADLVHRLLQVSKCHFLRASSACNCKENTVLAAMIA